MKPNLPTRLKN